MIGDAGNAFLFSDLAQNEFLRFAGTFNLASQQWETPRTGTSVALNSDSQVPAIASQVTLVPEPSVDVLAIGGAMALAARRRRQPLR